MIRVHNIKFPPKSIKNIALEKGKYLGNNVNYWADFDRTLELMEKFVNFIFLCLLVNLI